MIQEVNPPTDVERIRILCSHNTMYHEHLQEPHSVQLWEGKKDTK